MLLQPSSYKFSVCMYMVYFCTLVSNIWGQKFFLGPVTFKITFEIDWLPGPVALEAYYGGILGAIGDPLVRRGCAKNGSILRCYQF